MAKYQENTPKKRSLKKNIPPSPAKRLNRWQQIVNKYDDQLGFRPTFVEADQNIEDEFTSYTASRVVQSDILQFWQVCDVCQRLVFSFCCSITDVNF